MRKVTILEKTPGVFRLRIETRSMDNKRVFRYETVKGDEVDAHKRRIELLREGDPHHPLDEQLSHVTFGEYVERWLRKRYRMGEIKETTQEWYQRMIAYALPFIGHKRMRDIKKADIEEVYMHMLTQGAMKDQSPLHARTVRHLHARMKGIFRAAMDDEIIVKNPMVHVKQPKMETTHKLDTLHPDDIDHLMEKIKDDIGGIGSVIRFAIATGCRRGEIAALRWNDIDWREGTVKISRAAVVTDDNRIIERGPKTLSGRRTIKLPTSMLDELKTLYDYRMGESDYIFTTRTGERRNPAAMSTQVGLVLASCGLKRFTLHDLRHAHATMLLRRKHNPKAVSQRLGHSDVTITLQTYSHVMAEDDASLANDVDAIMTGSAPEVVPAEYPVPEPGTSGTSS
jgi:integrase